jgi:peptidoglycan/LPS O-acetylase OafA/YrhL
VHFLVIDFLAHRLAALAPATKQWLTGALPPLAIVIAFAAAALLASQALAFTSWHLFEKWFLALKRYFPGASLSGRSAR